MTLLSVIGSFIITFSLLSYGIGAISVVRFRFLSKWVLIFLSSGLLLDLIAIGFMMLGSNNSPFRLHGILGFSALLAMLLNVIIMWREFWTKGMNSKIPRKVVGYTKYAYLWWLIIYFAASIMVLW